MLLKSSQSFFLLLTIVGMTLSAFGLLTYPYKYLWLLFAAICFAVTICGAWINKIRLWTAILKTILLSVLLCTTTMTLVNILQAPLRRSYEYHSPNKENTVIIEYDWGSRPVLYRKHNWLFKSKIPLDTGGGYMEEVTYDVVWDSESRLTLTLGQYKSEYSGYKVDLSTGESEAFVVSQDNYNPNDW